MVAKEQIFSLLRQGLTGGAPGWTGEGLQAGVLVALTDESMPQVLLARRAQHLRLHPGEVAFPGGKREPEDSSPWATAKREAFEEVAMPPDRVLPLGQLPALTTRTGFEVHPCIATVPAGLALQVDPGELESLFWLPLATFADRRLYRLEKMAAGRDSVMVPHYQVGQDNIWGVTAAILAQIANLALAAGLDLQRNWSIKP